MSIHMFPRSVTNRAAAVRHEGDQLGPHLDSFTANFAGFSSYVATLPGATAGGAPILAKGVEKVRQALCRPILDGLGRYSVDPSGQSA
jgi:hypothetical protein